MCKYLQDREPSGDARTPACATGRTRNKPRPRRGSWRTKKAVAGTFDLYFLDKTGFSPSLSPTYTWARSGVRPAVPYESEHDGGLGCPRHTGRDGSLYLARRALRRRPAPGPARCPRVVVLDNLPIHRSRKVKTAAPELAQQNVHLYYLPAYNPELNDIEWVFRRVKHQAMPRRTFSTIRQGDAQLTLPNLLGPDA